MSTIAVNTITDASGGTTATINGYTPTVSNMAGRNKIINGAMVFDQRNGGASVTPTNNQYLVDRFQATLTQDSKFTVQQSSTAPVGFVNSLLVTSSSAYSVVTSDIFAIRQRIEGTNVADLGWGTANAKTVTLSFWVRSSLTGTFGGAFSNSGTNRSYSFTYTISVADTWEYKTVTVAGDTSGTWLTTNGIGINLTFGLGGGSDYSGTAGSWAGAFYLTATGATSVVGTNGATFYITGVQLEKGSVATPFDYRQYGTELALCQRYYEKSYDMASIAGAGVDVGSVTITCCGNINRAFGNITFKTPKRATPTLTLYSTSGASGKFRNTSQSTDITVIIVGSGTCGETGAGLICTSGIVSTTDTMLGNWVSSAEL
jgi:hypothetical protein